MMIRMTFISLVFCVFASPVFASESSDKWKDAQEQISIAAGAVAEASKETWEDSKEFTKEAWENSKDFTKDAWEGSKDVAGEGWEDSKDVGQDVWEETKEQTGKARDVTVEESKTLWEDAKQKVHEWTAPEE